MSIHCSQGVLDLDGPSAVPHVIIDPSPSVPPPADVEAMDSFAPSSSPRFHSSYANQLRKAIGAICHDTRISSFAEVLSCGLGADSVGLSGAGVVPVSLWLIMDEDRKEAFGPEDASIRLNLLVAGYDAAAVAPVPSNLVPELGCVDDIATELSICPPDGQFGLRKMVGLGCGWMGLAEVDGDADVGSCQFCLIWFCGLGWLHWLDGVC
ncbi:hypothetical protein Nepgr_021103 [Nepenthes gracilis]|uniref:Uncharacterized protein n=1 Tax=Nepenthes gracilis TaxID=150966 RepID=A0AAD3SZ71_NEPGR|nr:hypothetical protein Nepgr_021103 [Nepenthes gracilis]